MLSRLWRSVRGRQRATSGDRDARNESAVEQAYSLLQRGDALRARAQVQAAIARDPDSASAQFVLGMIEHADGDARAALARFIRASELQPDHYDAAFKAAMLLRDSDRIAESLSYFDTACALRDDAVTRNERAIAWLAARRNDRAERDLRAALARQPGFAPAYVNLALVCRNCGRMDEAREALQRALSIDSGLHEARLNLAALSRERDQPEQALAELEDLLRVAPGHSAAIALNGLMLREAGDAAAAVALLQDQHAPEALCNLGLALQDLGRFDEAHEAFERAAASGSLTDQAHYNRGQLRLLHGDYAAGWADYECRLQLPDAPPMRGDVPRWDGAPLEGRRLVVRAEQGIGDEIMFASCLPDVLQSGGEVILECDARLRALFATSFPGIGLFERSHESGALPDSDLEIAIGSLPGLFRVSARSFPGKAYLRTATAPASRTGTGLRIGVAWRGGIARTRQRTRSIDLEELAPRLARPGIELFCLQHDATAAERAQLDLLNARNGCAGSATDPIRSDEPADRSAIRLASLDLVVTVCQSLVHLSGALGVPTWVLTPFVPDWRYGADGEAIPWYASARLFRQTAFGQWSDPLERLTGALDTWVDAGGRA